MIGDIIFYGDPHGEWRPLLRACAEDPPDAVVLLGDCDLEVRLMERIAPLFEAGLCIRWIPGNHDTDQVAYYDNLWGDYSQGNLHATWGKVGDLTVGGLGGIFKERVWYPRFGDAEPAYASRRDYMRQVKPTDRFRGGLPLHQRDTIFPEDAAALAKLRVDVLVTHEAPTTHKYGFVGIDRIATACRARLVVHGHHHASYDAVTPDGIQVKGLAKAEVFRVRREDLA